ncbi:MAG: hypothetical protein VYD19_09115, partial [Myxococcota bacterium]|nr:hypothetical protein [Myxococcota bacterium]
EWRPLPLLSVGLQGTFGYHLSLSSEEASGEVKSRAIQQAGNENDFSQPVIDRLTQAAGVERVDQSKAGGVHRTVGAFVQLAF